MKRRVRRGVRSALAALVTAALLAGCGGSQTTTTEVTEPDVPATVPQAAGEEAQEMAQPAEPAGCSEIYDAVAAAVELPEMYFADDDFLMNYYGIDAGLLKDRVFASPEDAARVDTVIVLRLYDTADAAEVTAGLENLLAQMTAEMDNYLPEAHDLVTAAEVRQHGDLLDLVISADRETILSVIDGFLPAA